MKLSIALEFSLLVTLMVTGSGAESSLSSPSPLTSTFADATDEDRVLLRKMFVLMEAESKRSFRMESRLKSLEFKEEVQSRDMRTVKSKLDRLAKDNHEMSKQLADVLSKVETSFVMQRNITINTFYHLRYPYTYKFIALP